MATLRTSKTRLLAERKSKAIEEVQSLTEKLKIAMSVLTDLETAERVLASLGESTDDDSSQETPKTLLQNIKGVEATAANPPQNIGSVIRVKEAIRRVLPYGAQVKKSEIVEAVISLNGRLNPMTVGVELSRMSRKHGELISHGKGIYSRKNESSAVTELSGFQTTLVGSDPK
jgi:hypothetical protein